MSAEHGELYKLSSIILAILWTVLFDFIQLFNSE